MKCFGTWTLAGTHSFSSCGASCSSSFSGQATPFFSSDLESMKAGCFDVFTKRTLMHEIGHTVGLRHTDWKTRSSCTPPGPAEQENGAVWIDGTVKDTAEDTYSIMNACQRDREHEWSDDDRTAIMELFGG